MAMVLALVLTLGAKPRAASDHLSPQAESKAGPPFDPKLFREMRWRSIGPFRGGRAVAVSGVPHQPNVFYMAAVNGGVWKT